MKAFPIEYRQRVVELSDKGWTTKEIQLALGTSRAWVDSIKRLHKNGKSLEIQSSANHRTSLAVRRGEQIKAQVAKHPGTTLAELQKDLDLSESIWTIWQALRALGLSLKKVTPGRRTKEAGCRTKAGGMESRPNRTRPASTRFPRRDVRHHGDDSALRLGACR